VRVVALLLALAAAARPAGRWETGRLVHAGAKREWRLYVPPAVTDPGRPLPLLLVLHGGGGRGAALPRFLGGGFERLADRDGFFVAYPEGRYHQWNDGREPSVSRAHAEQVDDVGFLRELVADVSGRYSVDPARVYACGISNGALMACRLACELADRIAAVALVAGSFPARLAPGCAPARAVSVLMICGTDDPLVPFAGGTIQLRKGWKERGEVLGAREAAARWAALDGCPPAPSPVAALPDRDPADRTTVARETWGPGREGAAVTLLTVRGGGHTWPGARQYLPAALVGRVSRDVDGCAEIWAFLKPRARPRAPAGRAAP